MEKRYQVFVSSTYEDLREERAEVIQAFLELDCIPSGMELFPAGDDEQWTVIRRVIDECDYYIVIIAGRYGSIGPDGKSFTQMEYEYAVSKSKPVMAFLHENPGSIPTDKSEHDAAGREALQNFRDIAKKRFCKFWSSPKDLSGVVSRGISQMKQKRPAVGWVRGNLVPDESAAQEILHLRNVISVLQSEIAQVVTKPPFGTEELAKGEDLIDLHFEIQQGSRGLKPCVYEFTWNDILMLLGPVMLGPATEDKMQRQLEDRVVNRIRDEERVGVSVYMRSEDFHKITIQLKALGLITPVRGQNDVIKPGYWVLTPYGDTLMTQIAAIRSGDAKSSANPA